jgi:hypothetical protein
MVTIIIVSFSPVLIVTAIKDLFEDRRRYKSDKRVNNSCCRVFRQAQQQLKGMLYILVLFAYGIIVSYSGPSSVPTFLTKLSVPFSAVFSLQNSPRKYVVDSVFTETYPLKTFENLGKAWKSLE